MRSKSLFIVFALIMLFNLFFSGPPQAAAVPAMVFPDACGSRSAAALDGRLFLPLISYNSGILAPIAAANQDEKAPPYLPASPEMAAPPLDASVATDFATATAFLYNGSSPIQTGVAQGAVDPRRVGVLRGRATMQDGAPLPGVRIRIFDHGEYGQTLTRQDGMFDMAVNGGGQLTVCFEKAGYLPLHRLVQARRHDYAWLPEVVLLPLDSRVTTIDLASSAPLQVARGNVVNDADGTRQATLFFPQGTTAEMVMPDGSTHPVHTLSVRATEYTAGDIGQAAMPGDLPANSGYTYAAEFSIDEALAAGAEDVRFNRPVISYLENFLNFPAGMAVPVGYYDRSEGRWIPSENGRVIRILSLSGGRAQLDLDGSGQPANAAALSELGIDDAELAQLASVYQPGQSLWRVPIAHFSPWDCNWPFGPPPDAGPPAPPPPDPPKPEPNPCNQNGSIVECQNQVLGERVGITGVPFTINYRSNRTRGYAATRTLDIPLSGATLPASLARIDLEVKVAGQFLAQSFPPQTNQSFRFTWDGNDAYGRALQGVQPVVVRIGYVYPGVYKEPGISNRSFGNFGGATIVGNTTRWEITIWRDWQGALSTWDTRSQGLGGWTLSVHHIYDPGRHVLLLGDGQQRWAEDLNNIITTVAGNGEAGYSGDGGPATGARLGAPYAVAVAPDGSLYILVDGSQIRRIDLDGIITTLAGGGSPPDGLGDGGPALQSRLASADDVVIAPDGSYNIADSGHRRIRRVGVDGIITTVAGNGQICNYNNSNCGDGGPAAAAALGLSLDLALGPDGSLYIADFYGSNNRIRKVGPDGIITTVAGGGSPADGLGDGGPATAARLSTVRSIDFGPDGSLFIADLNGPRIRRVGPDGIITTVAGGGSPRTGLGDGGPATAARLGDTRDIVLGPDGALYMIDNQRIRVVTPDGTILTLAGTGKPGVAEDGSPALQAPFTTPWGLALAQDGSLYFAEQHGFRVRQVTYPVVTSISGDLTLDNLFIPAEDGSELFIFDRTGRHLRTLHALNGAVRYTFSYDGNGHLASITDAYGNATTIEHDSLGNPTAIVGPYGQRTVLNVNADGYLFGVANPAGETHRFTYQGPGGLLATFADPRGSISQISYDNVGRLARDLNAANGGWDLARVTTSHAYSVTLTSAAGRSTVYQVEDQPAGGQRWVNTFPDGTRSESLLGSDSSRTITYASGAAFALLDGPDPRWGMLARLPVSTTLTTPGGLAYHQAIQSSASLSTSDDLLSVVALTDTVNINGNPYTRVYEAALQTTHSTTPEGRQGSQVFDDQGRVIEWQWASLAPWRFTYDARGRLASSSQGSGVQEERVAAFAYNAQGYLELILDPLLQSTAFTYDPAGRVMRIRLAGGGEIQTSYDASGNLTTILPPGRPAHTFSYTADNLLAEYHPPDAGISIGSTRYTYNADRQLIRVDRPDGAAISTGYDAAGRLETTTFSRGVIRWVYNGLTGLLDNVAAPGGLGLTYSYDAHLPTGATWSGAIAGSVTHTYNDDFRLASSRVNGEVPVSYQYDRDGLLVQAGDLALSREAQTGFLTGAALGIISDTWSYNDFGELESYVAAAGNAGLLSAQYSRDRLGRIVAKVETAGGITTTYSFRYDPDGRLIAVLQNGAALASYTYDVNGNRLSAAGPGGTTSASYDPQDRLVRYGSTAYTYTANGELLTRTSGSQATTYSYDELGNLISASLPGGAQIEYLVDGQNRRIGKRVNGALVQGFLYHDQLRVAAELDGAGSVVSRFIYGERANVPEYMVKGGVAYRIITDHLGSTRLVVNAATGAVVQRIDYTAWGQVTLDTNPGFQPFGFAGGLYDADTGLVRFGARDYDAEIGRWTAKDPVLFSGGDTNLYGYVQNDPVNRIDPKGTSNLGDLSCGLLGAMCTKSTPVWAYPLCSVLKDTCEELVDSQEDGPMGDWFCEQVGCNEEPSHPDDNFECPGPHPPQHDPDGPRFPPPDDPYWDPLLQPEKSGPQGPLWEEVGGGF